LLLIVANDHDDIRRTCRETVGQAIQSLLRRSFDRKETLLRRFIAVGRTVLARQLLIGNEAPVRRVQAWIAHVVSRALAPAGAVEGEHRGVRRAEAVDDLRHGSAPHAPWRHEQARLTRRPDLAGRANESINALRGITGA